MASEASWSPAKMVFLKTGIICMQLLTITRAITLTSRSRNNNINAAKKPYRDQLIQLNLI